MKKISIFVVALFATLNLSAQCPTDRDVEKTVGQVAEQVQKAPAGTTYGVTKKDKSTYVLKTPIGNFTVKQNGNQFTCMGISVRLLSHKGSCYNIRTSLGDFAIDTARGTVTKL